MSSIVISIILSVVVAIAFAALFHLFFGGSSAQILTYIFWAIVGFAVGHTVGQLLQLNFLRIGPVNLLLASAGSWAFLFFARWMAKGGQVDSAS